MRMTRVMTCLMLAGMAAPALATNGYFSHGYGMTASSMGGAAMGMAEDAFGGANNPASMAFVGDRIDFGATLFSPIREASRTGGGLNGTSESGQEYFLVPEFGYNRMINPNMSLGVTVFGNGGMNSAYGEIPGTGANLLGTPGKLGVDLLQLIIAPTAAFKLAPNHAFGISPLLGYQRFKANGLQNFAPFSSDPANLTNNGYDDAFGYGLRVGYQGRITPSLTIGAAYSTKINMEEFSDYAGLFAEQGDFDIPSNFSVGFAWTPVKSLTLAVDYMRINYTDVAAVSNPVSNLLVNGQPLGADNGPGFGWDDQDVWKVGLKYTLSKKLSLMAGYNYGKSPINGDDLGEVLFNILAPATVEKHVTLGMKYTFASGGELTVTYMHAFENSISGADPLFGGTDTIQMYQNSLGVAYGWKL